MEDSGCPTVRSLPFNRKCVSKGLKMEKCWVVQRQLVLAGSRTKYGIVLETCLFGGGETLGEDGVMEQMKRVPYKFQESYNSLAITLI
ncbi:hypothetical protein RUM43_011249 [Polyplax serrata]|uniref:Uncharacterized protein n=1 Tax=Polyplax serrata TaxID=468196 RepID=A0AAN8NLU5_POLSC